MRVYERRLFVLFVVIKLYGIVVDLAINSLIPVLLSV